MRLDRKTFVFALFTFGVFGCAETQNEDLQDEVSAEDRAKLEQELPPVSENEEELYDLPYDSFSHGGEEDFSEECKPIPELEPLESPEIIVSIDGRTVHLRDREGDYDKVFPVGLGRISEGASLTPTSDRQEWFLRADWTQIKDAPTSDERKWAWNYSCRIWSGSKYLNKDSGQREYRSYFAGLPFLRVQGLDPAVYGIHGPISTYWREGGGELRRGYVSSGCMRMDADDLVELYARIEGSKVPIRIQQEVERYESGLTVDVADRFVGSECLEDSDCGSGLSCSGSIESTGRSFCTRPCTASVECPVYAGRNLRSYCMAAGPGEEGICLSEGKTAVNNACAALEGFTLRNAEPIDEAAAGVEVPVCFPR